MQQVSVSDLEKHIAQAHDIAARVDRMVRSRVNYVVTAI